MLLHKWAHTKSRHGPYLHFIRVFPENVFIKVPNMTGMVWRNIPVVWVTSMKTFPGSPCIYLDNFGLHFVRVFPEHVFIKVPNMTGMVRRTIPVVLDTFMKTFPGKSLYLFGLFLVWGTSMQ